MVCKDRRFALERARARCPLRLFPTRLRYSAMAIGYNMTVALFGGTAPLVATWMIKTTGNLAAPAWYLVATAAVTFIVVLTIRPQGDGTAA